MFRRVEEENCNTLSRVWKLFGWIARRVRKIDGSTRLQLNAGDEVKASVAAVVGSARAFVGDVCVVGQLHTVTRMPFYIYIFF
jgi:hypothetical protein